MNDSAPGASPAVLFWDIDGTLLSTARAGVFALEEAVREVCGVEPDFSKLSTAGLTDAEIARRVMANLGQDDSDERVDEFLRSYERHLPDRLHWRKGSVLPGVVEILDDLRVRAPDVHSLLLTGNTPAGARAKLTHYGLWDYFEGGEFCAAAEDRQAIADRAWRLAADRLGAEPDGERVFVIGDTPHDVRCGKAIGARTVAVATGPPSLEDLRACDPWLLLERLPDPVEFARLLDLP